MAERDGLPPLAVEFLAFMVGIAPGVFLVYRAVSAGEYSTAERAISFGLTGAVYLGLGGVFGWFRPEASWKWGFSLSLAGLALVMWNEMNRPADIAIDLGYIFTAFIAGSLGSFLGSHASRTFRKPAGEVSS